MDISIFDSPASDATKPRTGTLRRSCEACRSLKARCVLDTSAPQHQRRCQRCSSNGLDCVFEEALARPKRHRPAARTRVKDVEDKIDNLIALIAARNAATETPKSLADVLPLSPPSHEAAAVSQLPPQFSVDMVFPDFDLIGSPATPTELMLSSQDVFGKGILSLAAGPSLLAAFKDREHALPFAVLAPHMTFEYLRRERPCMLLAIMTTTAVDSSLQERLVDEFRQYVAQNVIVAGHKSIDIIQGIVIFCMWHHLCSKPHIHQLYQMSQVAVTMAIDLGLPALSQIHDMNLQKTGLAKSSRESNPQFWDDLERIRAYLYCYCVSNGISRAVRKPNQLKHSRRIEEAAKLITSFKTVTSDGVLVYFIQTQQFTEEVEAMFGYSEPDGMDEMDGWKIHAMAKAFERRLAVLKESMPPEILANPFIKMSILYLPIYITEISLKTPPGHGRNGVACCDWCISVYRSELIISCVRACHAFLDEYLALPNDVVRLFNVTEIGQHLYAIMILGYVSMRKNMGSLDVTLRSELANIAPYLVACENKAAAMFTYLPDGSVKQDSFWQLCQLYGSAASMLATWKAEPTLVPTDGECNFTLRLDELMDLAGTSECSEINRRIQKQAQALNPITPESPSDWGADHDLVLANLNSLSPPTGWF